MSPMQHPNPQSGRNPRKPSHRRVGGARGPANTIGVLMAVLLGGATVYGIYLVLPDHMKPGGARQHAPNEPEEPAEPVAETPAEPPPASDPPEPPTLPDPITEPAAPPMAESDPAAEPPLSPEELQAQREQKAALTLELAYRMIRANPDAAPDWFRKVAEEHPDTKAGAEAARWLENHTGR